MLVTAFESAFVDIAIAKGVGTLPVRKSIVKLAYVLVTAFKKQRSLTIESIVLKFALIPITVGIHKKTSAILLVVFVGSYVVISIREEIVALSFVLSLLKLPVVDIAVGVFKRSFSVIVIIKELTHVFSTVSEFVSAYPMVAVILELAHIVVAVVIIQSGYARWGIHRRGA